MTEVIPWQRRNPTTTAQASLSTKSRPLPVSCSHRFKHSLKARKDKRNLQSGKRNKRIKHDLSFPPDPNTMQIPKDFIALLPAIPTAEHSLPTMGGDLICGGVLPPYWEFMDNVYTLYLINAKRTKEHSFIKVREQTSALLPLPFIFLCVCIRVEYN